MNYDIIIILYTLFSFSYYRKSLQSVIHQDPNKSPRSPRGEQVNNITTTSVTTTTDNEEVNIVGVTATSAFRVDTGFATLDEQAVLTAGATAAASYVSTATAADAITLSGAAH